MHDAATMARFVATGLGAAALLFVLIWSFTTAGLPPFIAGTAGYAIAFVVAYLVQRSWSFGGRHGHRRALPRYFIAQAVAALISGTTAHIASSIGWDKDASALLATLVASAVSFGLALFWVFPAQAEN